MSDSIQFDQAALAAAQGQMEAAYAKLAAEFDKVTAQADSISPNWQTPEGAKFVSKYEAIRSGIAEFKSSYSSISSFLSSAVSANYVDAEAEIGSSILGGAPDGGD